MRAQRTYEGWDMAGAQEAGFDAAALSSAIDFCLANESPMDRDIGKALDEGHFGEPWPISKTIGPTKGRADPAGVILRGGRIVASWGDVERVDMTFSITKSYLAICAGIAVDDGLIPEIDAPVRSLVDNGLFDGAQNRGITWRQLLQLTSEWEGTLWDKPDWIDHNRVVMEAPGDASAKGQKRTLKPNGTYWEYNDVRVNVTSLALMHVFGRPIPEVLKARVMDPIGASDSWEWHGYENSWIEINGRPMQAVPGGAHWGGGLWISTLDHARMGQLMLNKGFWCGRRILSERWVETMMTPCPLNPSYGMLWWLNTAGHAVYPSASPSSAFAIGVGTNLIWVDPEHDLVIVLRWVAAEAVDGFAAKVMAALRD